MKRLFAALVCAVLFGAPPAQSAMPVTKSGFVITRDRIRLHYLESGNGSAILFVPGWTMPAEIWEPQIHHFSRRYRVVAMDPRSQGESTKASEGHHPERRAADIKEVVDQLKLAPVVLVGWSLGVPEALTYVDQFGTATLRAVVLVDGQIGDEPNPKILTGLGERLKQMQVSRRDFADKFVRSMYRKRQPEEYYRKIIAASLKTPTNTAVTLLANAYTADDRRHVLAKLDCPVLYAVTPQLKEQASMLRTKLPHARVEIFPDAGHALFVDDAARFNRVLESFLDALPASK